MAKNEKEILADFLNEKVCNLKDGETVWVFPNATVGLPDSEDFPRVYLTNNAGVGTRVGNNRAIMVYDKVTQFTIYVKRNYIYTEKGVDYEGDFLAELIGKKLIDAFEDFGYELYPSLFDLDINTTLTDMDFDYDKDLIQKFFTLEYSHLKLV